MERLLNIVRKSVKEEDIETSVIELRKLGKEVLKLGEKYFK